MGTTGLEAQTVGFHRFMEMGPHFIFLDRRLGGGTGCAAAALALVCAGFWGCAAGPVRRVEATVELPGKRLSVFEGRLIFPLVEQVLKNEVYLQAKAIRDKSGYFNLPPHVLKDLEAHWKAIETEQARLVAEARTLEREAERLYRRGMNIDKQAARLAGERDGLNRSVDEWRASCGQTASPCEGSQAVLARRARPLERAIGKHNKRVGDWRRAVAGFDQRVGFEPSP